MSLHSRLAQLCSTDGEGTSYFFLILFSPNAGPSSSGTVSTALVFVQWLWYIIWERSRSALQSVLIWTGLCEPLRRRAGRSGVHRIVSSARGRGRPGSLTVSEYSSSSWTFTPPRGSGYHGQQPHLAAVALLPRRERRRGQERLLHLAGQPGNRPFATVRTRRRRRSLAGRPRGNDFRRPHRLAQNGVPFPARRVVEEESLTYSWSKRVLRDEEFREGREARKVSMQL